MEPNEIDKFFGDLPSEDKDIADIFDEKPETVAKPKEGEDIPAKEPRKNHQHRRLEKQLAEEREARIRAEAIAQTRAENRNESQGASVDERLYRIFSNDDIGKAGAATLAELLRETHTKAKEEALEEIQQRIATEQTQQREFESFIDNELESIEEDYDVDITSDAPAARKMRHELRALVEKLSPKDENGLLTGYADFKETFELYQARKEKAADTTSRAKEVAARSMAKPGSTAPAPQQPTPGFRGWMKDFNVNN